MHAHISHGSQHGLRNWFVVVIIVAVLALMGIVWDRADLGDGLVLGKDASVTTVWDRATGRVAQDDFLFGAPSGEQTATTGR